VTDVLHNFNPTLIASFDIVNIGLYNLKLFKIVLVLYQVCFVPWVEGSGRLITMAI
jgi:uncharacterized membrane protein YiaA